MNKTKTLQLFKIYTQVYLTIISLAATAATDALPRIVYVDPIVKR